MKTKGFVLVVLATALLLSAPADRAQPVSKIQTARPNHVSQKHAARSDGQGNKEPSPGVVATDIQQPSRETPAAESSPVTYNYSGSFNYRVPPAPSNDKWGRGDWFNFLLAVFTGALVLTSLLQWKVIGRQAKIAEDTLTEQSRPWVSSQASQASIVSPLMYGKDGASLQVRIRLKNTGHSVAACVWPHLKMVALTSLDAVSARNEIVSEQRLLEAEVREKKSQNPNLGFTLFPGDMREVRQFVRVSQVDIAKASSVHGVRFAILECVDYRFSFGPPDDRHQTLYVLDLLQRSANGSTILFEPDERVPQGNLILGLSFDGESTAT